MKKARLGFTIVELLIVIVVIAILAAISIVAYTGIQNRARAGAARSLAGNVAKKVEIYNVDESTSGYPGRLVDLTASAASSRAYYIPPADVIRAGNQATLADNPTKSVIFSRCGHSGSATAPVNLAAITSVTGVRVGFWSGSAVEWINVGNVNQSVSSYPVACHISNA